MLIYYRARIYKLLRNPVVDALIPGLLKSLQVQALDCCAVTHKSTVTLAPHSTFLQLPSVETQTEPDNDGPLSQGTVPTQRDAENSLLKKRSGLGNLRPPPPPIYKASLHGLSTKDVIVKLTVVAARNSH
jgi:hypothetical protein